MGEREEGGEEKTPVSKKHKNKVSFDFGEGEGEGEVGVTPPSTKKQKKEVKKRSESSRRRRKRRVWWQWRLQSKQNQKKWRYGAMTLNFATKMLELEVTPWCSTF